MENKTCSDCKSFPGMGYYCPIIGRFCDPNNEKPCEFFEKPMGRIATNGDVLRQMGNDELATAWSEQAFLFAWCYDCMEYCKDGSTPENKLKCKNRMLKWLNAPADCVAKVPKKARGEQC